MNSIPIQPNATATIHHRRPVLPVLNLLVAGAAVTLAAVAIATDDTGSITPQPSPLVAAAAVEAPALWWADPAQHPANRDVPRSAVDTTGEAPALWLADPAQHPANQDVPRSAVDTAGEAPALWWAERR
jgi:hypothetical protein